ncbi:MAG: sugar phosphate nucleotidyltransferase [Leptospira sp.]|nr:sugar phosphate nucleotidyltransferase [Leptospira sp.]
MNQKDILRSIISPSDTIKQAIKQLNENSLQILLVADSDHRLLGTVTDGDIRRELEKNWDLNQSVELIMNQSPRFLYESERESAHDIMIKEGIRHIPILNFYKKILDLVLFVNLENVKKQELFSQKKEKVFILAGGKGTRLKPFTNIIPKPLIPLGETPIVEIIMDRFQYFGFNQFILSINFKAEMIRSYFVDNPKNFQIDYVKEEEFLGTAGSLYFLKNNIKETLIISNCDVILDINFDNFFKYHQECENDITVVGVIRHVKIPYGVMEISDRILQSIKEKPEYDIIVNAGIYAVEYGILDLIEDKKYLDMPDLLQMAKAKGKKVGVYLVSAEMIDVGHWDEYKLAEEKARQLGFIL